MYQFYCKPDFEKLNSLYNLDIHEDSCSGLDDFNKQEGYFESFDFDQTTGMEFESSFKSLLEEFNISDHYNDLMFLVQSKYKTSKDLYIHNASLYSDNFRSKEMASLITFLNEERNKQALQLSLSSPTDSIKVKDSKLTEWIFQTLNKGIDSWYENQPFMKYGELFNQSFFESPDIVGLNRDKERLNKIANLKIPKYTKQLTKIKAEICLFLHTYLQTYSLLNATVSTYSDNQYRFWFKLLEMLDLQEEQESDPTDYMASLISNYNKSNT